MKKLLLIFFFALVIPSVSHGAIVFDTLANGGFVVATSLTYPITVTSTANTYCWVYTYSAAGSGDNVTGATINGLSTTLAGKNGNSTQYNFGRLWYLAGVASGTHDIVVNASGSTNMGSSASCYAGVAQSAPEATTTNQGLAVGSLTTTLTTITNNDWTVMVAVNNVGTWGAGAGTRMLVGSSSDYGASFDSNGAITPAGSTSLIADPTNSGNIATVMATMQPFSAAAPTTARRRAMIIQPN